MTPEEQAALKLEVKRSKAVDKEINQSQMKAEVIHKILLLGAGGSGKSTLFKQMITIYGKGFSMSQRKGFIKIIYGNVVSGMQTLCHESQKYGPVSPENADICNQMLQVPENASVDTKIGSWVKMLWNDKGIQSTFEKRSKFQLGDSAAYFFGNIDEIMKADYVPSEQDLLRSRVPTTGIVENLFDVEKNQFQMFDVGGQRSERKKWIHCFENVTAVLFVAALSEYDQVLFEDENTNRMEEALELFEEILNSEWFEKTSMILFLNKKDLFAEKIQKVPLKEYLTDYRGANTYEETTEYIKLLFESKKEGEKDIYTHMTCATDTNNIFSVFNAVKDIIIKEAFTKVGLM